MATQLFTNPNSPLVSLSCTGFSTFFLSFFLVTFGMVSTDMYYLNKVMSTLFLDTPMSETDNTDFRSIASVADVWKVKFLLLFFLCLFKETGGKSSFKKPVVPMILFYQKMFAQDPPTIHKPDKKVIFVLIQKSLQH